jgi:hypothetical protein
VAIADPPAGVLVEAVEEILRGAEEPDRGGRGAQRLQVLREEPLPEVLAEREEARRGRDGQDVAVEAEPAARAGRRRAGVEGPLAHDGLDSTMKLLFHVGT